MICCLTELRKNTQARSTLSFLTSTSAFVSNNKINSKVIGQRLDITNKSKDNN